MAGRALVHLRRAFGAIEEVQRTNTAVPRTAWLLQDARAELEKGIAFLEEMRR